MKTKKHRYSLSPTYTRMILTIHIRRYISLMMAIREQHVQTYHYFHIFLLSKGHSSYRLITICSTFDERIKTTLFVYNVEKGECTGSQSDRIDVTRC